MIILSLFLIRFGFIQEDNELPLGIKTSSLVLYAFLLLKWINKLCIGTDSVRIKNIILGQKTIFYKEIKQWDGIFRHSLKTHWTESERKYS